MRFKSLMCSGVVGVLLFQTSAWSCDFKLNNDVAVTNSPSVQIKRVMVKYNEDLGSVVFRMELKGPPSRVIPKPAGNLDGAPVMGYVFPTTLKAVDVGMGNAEGIVALAITSHPDFDDTPLWDEDSNGNYSDDKAIYHTHWVLLAKDDRVPGGLSVKEFKKEEKGIVLPPTNPGMPMYMDSPGHAVVEHGNNIQAVVPAYYMRNETAFSFDGVVCYMQVNTSCMSRPMLGVYAVYSVASNDLSLPFKSK
jgi:hypothetical protein